MEGEKSISIIQPHSDVKIQRRLNLTLSLTLCYDEKFHCYFFWWLIPEAGIFSSNKCIIILWKVLFVGIWKNHPEDLTLLWMNFTLTIDAIVQRRYEHSKQVFFTSLLKNSIREWTLTLRYNFTTWQMV